MGAIYPDTGGPQACPHGLGTRLPGLPGGGLVGAAVGGALALAACRPWPVEPGFQALLPQVPPWRWGSAA